MPACLGLVAGSGFPAWFSKSRRRARSWDSRLRELAYVQDKETADEMHGWGHLGAWLFRSSETLDQIQLMFPDLRTILHAGAALRSRSCSPCRSHQMQASRPRRRPQ